MTRPPTFNTLLVPIDFSPASMAAVEWSIQLLSGEDATVLLVHVIDSSLVNTMVEHGFGTHEEVVQRLRSDAGAKLDELEGSGDGYAVKGLICEGLPFVEIVQKATDFDVDAVVMSKLGQRRQFETLLFGSTAEKVTRGCRQPVIVLPSSETY